MFRNYNCNELNINFFKKKVLLCGWILNIRKYKKIIFIDLEDYYGITQLIIKKNKYNKYYNKIIKEHLIKIKGIVKKRININKNIKTGQIEVLIKKIYVINKLIKTIFLYKINIKNYFKYKYRYLYFRNKKYKKILLLKNKMYFLLRKYLYKKNILEIDTPILSEYLSISGANVFIININNKKKFELSQSPQIYKQLLMIGRIDKYYQISKCFRKENFRKDRQIEFTQLDFEFCFKNIKNIINFSEKIITFIFYNIFKKKIYNFKYIKYKKCIKKYGTDKPNLFFNIKINKIKINNIHYLFFKINKKYIKIINLINIIKKCNNKNKYIYYIIYKKKNYINNYINNDLLLYFNKKKCINIIFVFNFKFKIYFKLGQIINEIINIIKIKYNKYYPIWILDYPLFKKKKKKIISFNHPFVSPKNSKKIKINSKSKSYDLVINGLEIASGSIRINKYKLQKKIFSFLKINKKKIKKYFGFFLNALKYSAPPHGGIAFGLERILSLIFNKDIINIIPFPKKEYEK